MQTMYDINAQNFIIREHVICVFSNTIQIWFLDLKLERREIFQN